MTRERLELVTDFATLRAGMITVVTHCDCGRAKCRAMLTTCEMGSDGDPCWMCLPDCSESWDPDFEWGIQPATVATGHVYRVIDGLENEQATTTTKKRDRVK